MGTDPLAVFPVEPKFVTLGLFKSKKNGEVGVSFTITGLESGNITVGFTEAEAEEAWQAMQRWSFKAEAENHRRRMNAQEN